MPTDKTSTSSSHTQLLNLMREDAKRELRNQLSLYQVEWKQQYDAYIEAKRHELVLRLKPFFVDATVLIFINKKKNEDEIASILSTFFKELAPDTPTLSLGLQSYYEERRAALCSLFHERDKTAQFPEWPHLWLNYITSTSPVPRPDDHIIRDMAHAILRRDFEPLRVHWTKYKALEDAYDNIIKPIFKSMGQLPEDFIKELLYQTLELWGDTPCEVFRRRMNLLLQKVLKPALVNLGIELSAFGRNEARWVKQAPVAEMVASILQENTMKTYRQLLQSVCDDLDKLAKALPDFYPPKQFTRIYTVHELYTHMRCAFINASDFPQAFMKLLAEEQENINRYYSHILSKQYVTGTLPS